MSLPWDWCETVKQQTRNNSYRDPQSCPMKRFTPSRASMIT